VKTILLVEDDETFRYTAARHLTEAGYVVITAPDSMAALRELSSGCTIDLLLTDIVMPQGKPHGIALARMARMRRTRLPVVLMTGYDGLFRSDEELPGPIFSKPIDMAALTAAIGEQLAS
jgi:CheY-like chemotaxis protein